MSLLAAVVALADLCATAPEPAADRDPADSAAYTAVGDEAAAGDDARTAAIAYRKAIALDPANDHAKTALAALCKDATAAGDDSALLDAIARYRAGDRAAATTALAAIAGSHSAAAAGAHFFLGLFALDRHDTRTAIPALEKARADPEYRDLAASLLRLAHRDGALAFALLVEPELDTNPQLLPDTPPVGAITGVPDADSDLLTAATITARPWPWLAVRNVLTWRDQRRLSALDFVGEDLQALAELTGRRDRIALRYDLDYDLLAGTRYLLAHRAGAAARHEWSQVALVASYSLRRRDYARDAERPFTGWVHAADTGAVIRGSRGLELDARLYAGREITSDGSFANLSGGIRLALRTRGAAPIRLTTSAATGYARYDLAQPDGQLRRDVSIEASADLEIDLGDHVIAVAGADVTRNASSIEDFRYAKLVVRGGLVFALGGL